MNRNLGFQHRLILAQFEPKTLALTESKQWHELNSCSQIVEDFVEYSHSSAAFHEEDIEHESLGRALIVMAGVVKQLQGVRESNSEWTKGNVAVMKHLEF